MPEMQELIEKYARSKSPADYAEIVKMAHAGEGLAVYWQPHGPVTIA